MAHNLLQFSDEKFQRFEFFLTYQISFRLPNLIKRVFLKLLNLSHKVWAQFTFIKDWSTWIAKEDSIVRSRPNCFVWRRSNVKMFRNLETTVTNADVSAQRRERGGRLSGEDEISTVRQTLYFSPVWRSNHGRKNTSGKRTHFSWLFNARVK